MYLKASQGSLKGYLGAYGRASSWDKLGQNFAVESFMPGNAANRGKEIFFSHDM